MERSTAAETIVAVAADGCGTRGRLVRAAAELLRNGGPAAASARAVCDAAGVRAPTLYHHFGDLAGLHRAVVDAAFAETLRRKVARPPPADGGDPLDDLRRGWDGYVRFAIDEPALFAVITGELLAGRRPPAHRRGYEMLTAEVARLADRRPLRYPPAVAAHLVWASAHGAAVVATAGDPAVGRSAAFLAAAREAMLRDLVEGETATAAAAGAARKSRRRQR